MAQTAGLDSSMLPGRPEQGDWTTIGLVGAAHASSHFFQLVIPSLFVPLGQAFALDFVQLGFLMTLFFVVSGFGQAASGFVVDRIGARPVLWFGVACFLVAALVLYAATGYGTLMLAALIGGIGNAVFHPADFSILNHRVQPSRLGHAFSIHNVTGTLGWALSPVFVVGLTALFGWRSAALAVALLMALVLVLIVLGRESLEVPGTRELNRRASEGEKSSEVFGDVRDEEHRLKSPGVLATLRQLLASPALWGAFLFFCCATVALSAVQNYTIPLMGSLYGMAAVAAGSVITAYMVGQIVGMLAGGFLVNATPRTELVVLASLLLSATMFVLLASGVVPGYMAMFIMSMAGFFSGASAPSRDMMVRKVTPKRSVGSVYGLVYSGMDVGSALGPLMFGIVMDWGWERGPWMGAALAFVVGAMLAAHIGRYSRMSPSAATA
ncbi:MFS transporter [Orrella marina]|nr:MFS transporter [Orrella marina]